MGNSYSYNEDKCLNKAEREAMERFCESEISVLQKIFKGITQSTTEQYVGKEDFLKILPMPGMLGERLFAVFDKNGSGSICFSEFVCGLAILCKGTMEEKMKFVFDIYDLTDVGSISKTEMVTMMNQFPQSAMEILHKGKDISTIEVENLATNDADMLVDDAFRLCKLENDDRMRFDQFFSWCQSRPAILEFLVNVLPLHEASLPVEPKRDCKVHVRRKSYNSKENILKKSLREGSGSFYESEKITAKERSYSTSERAAKEAQLVAKELLLEARMLCGVPKAIKAIDLAIDELDCYQISRKINEIRREPSMEGYLWKKGNRLKQLKKRYYYLNGNFLYYYQIKGDTKPKGVIYMCGCYVEIKTSNPVNEKQNLYEFELCSNKKNTVKEERKILFTKTSEEREQWVKNLQTASCKVSIEQYYEIGRELGKGRFSHVCEAVHKGTGEKFAVKVIDKAQLGVTEKELLRTEIAILKLVKHPHIIRFRDVFENKKNIYIVTELLSGGELFNKIVGRSRYSEYETRLVMRPLFESVVYLHKLGIVHRDIKPENILCGEKLTDLRIADFGLSKLVHPHEIMKMPCGTLNYVAPEVLSLVGYGKEADIWSLGVIMHLLLSGELPFHGKHKNDIIQNTLTREINGIDIDIGWSTISVEAKSLVKGLLQKTPSKRLAASEALAHPWLQQYGSNSEI